MAYEALNHAGHLGSPLLVVLNDNAMSIERNVGAMSAYLSRLRLDPKLSRFRHDLERYVQRLPGVGERMATVGSQLKDGLKAVLVPGMLFEELGFTYVGVVDGHDIQELRASLRRALALEGPVLLHCRTTKGKGYEPAERHPGRYHGIPPSSRDLHEGVGPRGPDHLHAGVRRGARGLGPTRRTRHRHHGGHGGRYGTRSSPADLPGALLRRGDRRGARRRLRRGPGCRGKASGGGHLLDVPAEGLRPDHPRRLPAGSARGLRRGPSRPGGRGRAHPPWGLRPFLPAHHPRPHRVRSQGRSRTAATPRHRAAPWMALRSSATRARREWACLCRGPYGLSMDRGSSSCARDATSPSWPSAPAWDSRQKAAALLAARGIEATVANVRRVRPLDGESSSLPRRESSGAAHGGGQRPRRRFRFGRPRVAHRPGPLFAHRPRRAARRLRGAGSAGRPTQAKWDSTRRASRPPPCPCSSGGAPAGTDADGQDHPRAPRRATGGARAGGYA